MQTDRLPQKISVIIDNYLFSLYKRSENTQKTYTSVMKQFAVEMPQNIDQITVEHLERYIFDLQKKYKDSSVNLFINVIKSFYGYSSRNGHKDIGKYIKTLPALPPEQRILSKREYELVCRKISQSSRLDCFKFLCNTGLRVSELVSLGSENVANGFLRVIGKGRRTRSIPLNNTAKEIHSRNPNFEMIERKNRIWIWRGFKKIASQAGIEPFYPHSCRHYFANELYHNGVDMFIVSRLLGHADTKVTENVYVHWAEESLLKTTDVLAD